jgi:hypothetical protein
MEFGTPGVRKSSNITVIYNEAESSFDVVPRPDGGVASILVNDLQLEVDHTGTVLYAWGLFPHPTTWKQTSAYPENPSKESLIVEIPSGVIPGVSCRVNPEIRWPVYVNVEERWFCLGEPAFPASSRSIEFAKDSVAVLLRDQLIAIWLHPAGE